MGRLESSLLDGSISSMPRSIKVHSYKELSVVKPSFYIVNMECSFENYHFVLPTDEAPPLRIGKKEYNMRGHRIMPINPGQTLKVETNKIKTMGENPHFASSKEYIALFINKRLMQETAYNAFGRTEVVYYNHCNVASNRIKELLNNYTIEYDNNSQGRSLMLDSISILIMIQLLREVKNNIAVNSIGNDYMEKSRAQGAIEFIREFYNSDIRLEDLCKIANLSPYHFIRVFKGETGKTPHEYLMDVKIERAQELIEANEYTLGEIAGLTGFVRQSHFSAVFKKKIGVSPLVYQKNKI